MHKEEDEIERLQMQLFDAEADGNTRKVAALTEMFSFACVKVDKFNEEIAKMKKMTFGDGEVYK
jgi:hypothetical protein